MDRHITTVTAISRQVSAFHASKTPFRISHGSTNSTRLSTRQANRIVDTSALRHVLSIDTERKLALVEPNVPMDKLVDVTLRYGLIPPVVMEFPGITVGGGFAGTSGESSSFRHGFFDRTIEGVEMVLGDGEVVDITRGQGERQDLLEGAPGTLGTMGITTLVRLRLLEANGAMVETTYWPVKGVSEAVKTVKELTTKQDGGYDYVDGILFSKDHGAIITGRLLDKSEMEQTQKSTTRTFTNATDEWFYLHVKEVISRNAECPTTELVPIYDYLFRYDRGGFWVGASAFRYMLNFPFNRFTRWFLDDFMRTRMLYKALHASECSHQFVVQDLALPFSSAEQFINYTNDKFNIWPLWLCPLKQSPQPTMHPHLSGSHKHESQMLNVGLWGFGPSESSKFIALSHDLERKLKELGGMKWLYAQTYYSEPEFWDMFDKEWYDSLRQKYRATHLPSVYDKIKSNVRSEQTVRKGWKQQVLSIRLLGGLWGIWKAILSGEWIKVKRGSWDNIEDSDVVQKAH